MGQKIEEKGCLENRSFLLRKFDRREKTRGIQRSFFLCVENKFSERGGKAINFIV